MNGTYTYRVPNNAAGPWITFPVQGDATHDITVEVLAPGRGSTTTYAGIAALAFDPLDSHQTTYTYNGTSDVNARLWTDWATRPP